MVLSLISEPARPVDLPALRALHCANWRRDYAALLPDHVFGAPMAAYMDRKWAATDTDGMQVRLTRSANTVCGFVAFFDRRGAGLFVDNLHVAATARGQGVGKALMLHVAEAAGPRPVALEVLEGNRAARAIYRAWGGAEGARRGAPLLGVEIAERPVRWRSGAALANRLRRRAA